MIKKKKTKQLIIYKYLNNHLYFFPLSLYNTADKPKTTSLSTESFIYLSLTFKHGQK